jgi:hypothetical protein
VLQRFFFEDFFREGTLAPSRRASESPIAIACLRLVTFFPERPLRSVPRFRLCMARLTFFAAFLLYFAIECPFKGRRTQGAGLEMSERCAQA